MDVRGVEAADDAGLGTNILRRGLEKTVDTGRLAEPPADKGSVPWMLNSVAKFATRSWMKIRIGIMRGVRRNQSH